MAMRPLICAAAAASGLTLAMPAMAFYDLFDRGFIVPQYWTGEENTPVRGSHAEVQRAIVDGQLRLQSKGYADNDSNTGATTVRHAMITRPLGTIVGMSGRITAVTASATGCSSNPTPTVIRARLFGYFFNAGPARPGTNYNDVFAMAQVSRSSASTDLPDVLRVNAFVGQCLNDDCSQTKTLTSLDLGTVRKGEAVHLSVDWSQYWNRFTFGHRFDWQTWDYHHFQYDVSDQAAATVSTKRLEVSSQIAHCMPTRASAHGIVDFDEVIFPEEIQTSSLR